MVHPRYEYSYDKYGNQTSIRDNIFQLDPTDAATVFYNHNANMGGDFTQDYNTRVTKFTYDHLNRQTSRTLPLGVAAGDGSFQEEFFYDSFGRQSRHVDFEGRTVDFIYDELGRLEEKRFFTSQPAGAPGTVQGEELVDYVYDAVGREQQVIQDFDAASTGEERITTNSYDPFGRLTRASSNQDGAVNYEYFENTGLLKRTYTGNIDATGTPMPGVAVTDTRYGYDRLGRLKTVTVHERNDQPLPVPEVTSYKYDAAGNLQSVTYGTSSPPLVAFYTYDDLNRLALLRYFRDASGDGAYSSGEQRLSEYDYTVRSDGKRTGVTETIWPCAGVADTWDRSLLVVSRAVRRRGEKRDLP
jgi:hypothetical protein